MKPDPGASHLWRSLMLLGLVAIVACSPAARSTSRDGRGPGADSGAPERAKTITIASLNAIKSYGPWSFSSTPGGAASLAEVHTMGLTYEALDGSPEARVAAGLPSFDDGTITVLPDGRMQTTWKLRPGVKWHDGSPFTADDVVFSWDVARHPETVSSIEPVVNKAESVQAIDPLTIVITWKSPFYRALELGHREPLAWTSPRSCRALL